MINKLVLAVTVAAVGVLASVITAYAAGAIHQTTDVFVFGDPSSVVQEDGATLVRNGSGVRMTLHTQDLNPGHAYTVWWVGFNNPAACVDGCDGADLAAAEAAVFFAGGHVVGSNGKGNFAGHTNEGTLPTGPGQVPFDFSGGDGIRDVDTAEIHLVVRDHGPKVPGLVDAQISSFGGGCTPASDPTGIGPAGDYDCVDAQAAVFGTP